MVELLIGEIGVERVANGDTWIEEGNAVFGSETGPFRDEITIIGSKGGKVLDGSGGV